MTLLHFMTTILAIASFVLLLVWSWRDYVLEHCSDFIPNQKRKWDPLVNLGVIFEETVIPYTALCVITTGLGLRILDIPYPSINYVVPLLSLILYLYIQYRYMKRMWDFINAVTL